MTFDAKLGETHSYTFFVDIESFKEFPISELYRKLVKSVLEAHRPLGGFDRIPIRRLPFQHTTIDFYIYVAVIGALKKLLKHVTISYGVKLLLIILYTIGFL